MALQLLEFVKQFMMYFFLLKLTQFEKTGSIGKIFISLVNLIINFHYPNEKSITFFDLYLLLFDNGVCLPFNNGNTLKSKKNHKKSKMKKKSARPISEYSLRSLLLSRVLLEQHSTNSMETKE